MKKMIIVMLLLVSSFCNAVPIRYLFEGVTDAVIINSQPSDPSIPLTDESGNHITNGNTEMIGKIVFDPDPIQLDNGVSTKGRVLSWQLATQGLVYSGGGGLLSYITFTENSFEYLDEVPQGGHGPDVVGMGFNFSGNPFSNGFEDFPVDDFVEGMFVTSVEFGRIDESSVMNGLKGIVTSLWKEPISVPEPATGILGLLGLVAMCCQRRNIRKGYRRETLMVEL